ncbi:SDR family NAD(P)-dependent oxidoreductase, partial [Arthrospira platensis SPKY1]|nr:SDR family NAD(P)-dependent oxidoreductase [Arthrospira platensis SPKY1]
MKFFISGGSRGIGAQIVKRAAADGHDVAFSYLSQREQALALVDSLSLNGNYGRVAAFRMDTSNSGEVDSVVEEAGEFLGGIDVAVANAGINSNGLLVHTSDEDWSRVLN